VVTTYPFSWYVDRDVLRREDERIFARAWRYVGHADDHEPTSSARVETWGPFVFANPDRDAPPLAEALGEIPAQLRQLGLDVDALAFHHRSEWELDANWKIVCENFLECYHCPVAHPSFSQIVDVSPDAYRLEAQELTSSQFGPLRDATNAAIPRSQFHFLWPNTGINVFAGEPNLSIGPILPLSPERTRRYLDYFFGEDVTDEWIAELLELDDTVGAEDKALVEGVQRGVRTRTVERGALLGQSEQLVTHFQRLTAGALA
jgi:phenylpropionate dioxygenase-like ring-hydroxylating dioxygenase large terminal subunit